MIPDFPPNSIDLAIAGDLRSPPDGWEADPREFLRARAGGLVELSGAIAAGLDTLADIPGTLALLEAWREQVFLFSMTYKFPRPDRDINFGDLPDLMAAALGEPVKGISTSPDFVAPMTAEDADFAAVLGREFKKVAAGLVPRLEKIRDGKMIPTRYVDTWVGLDRPFPQTEEGR